MQSVLTRTGRNRSVKTCQGDNIRICRSSYQDFILDYGLNSSIHCFGKFPLMLENIFHLSAMNGSNYVTDCHMMTQALKVYASFAGFDKYYASLKENKNQDNRLSSKRRGH